MPERADLTSLIEQSFVALTRPPQTGRLHEALNARAGVDLDRSAYLALSHIVDNGRTPTSTLAAACWLDISTLSRIGDRLVERGLARREPGQHDRRVVELCATPEGIRVVQLLRDVRRKALAHVVSQWTNEDIETFGRLMSRFAAELSSALAEGRFPVSQEEPA